MIPYNLKTNIASIKVTNKYNSYSTFSIKPALQMGEMDSELEALEIPLLGDYEVHHLLCKKISDIVAVSNPTPSLQQRRSIKPALQMGEMDSKLEALEIPLLGDYEVHHLLRKKISDIVAVSNPTPSLQQRRSIKQAATIQILELKSTTIKLLPLRQRGVEWAQ